MIYLVFMSPLNINLLLLSPGWPFHALDKDLGYLHPFLASLGIQDLNWVITCISQVSLLGVNEKIKNDEANR